ncbi:MAG: fibronectin type III domain-containing protein, partial [Clostridia bacterium]|nr:fibronectin type III domain-containing protein [Clostridia bacterium]
CYYNLKINTYTDKLWEDEFNDTSKQAMNIACGKTYKGALQNCEDADWFVFDNTSGAFNVEFKLDESTSYNDIKNGWKIEVYKFGSNESLVTYNDIVSELNSFSIPFKGKILVKISAALDLEDYAPIDCIYNLKISQRATSELWENENNDTMTSATKLTSGKKYNANLYNCDDVDCFKYTSKSNGVLKFNFSRDVTDNIGAGWKVQVVKVDGTIVCEDIVKNSLTLTKILIPVGKGETLYIKIFADYSGDAPEQVDYQLRVDFTANPGKVTGLKASSNKTTSVKLSWKALDGATGYRVYRYDAASKKYVIVATTKSTSYTVKNLKAGTSYKFVVKAYKKVDGSNLWGSTSAALTTATTPDTPTLKVAAGKKSATLKWSKETGTGYVVYMATSKNGKYSKIATVKGSSNISTVKKNLTTGKTYYFKVRAYKTVGDSNLYGAYTTVKAVKVK